MLHPAVPIVMTAAARRASLPQPFLRHSFALEDSSLFFGTYCECAPPTALSPQDVLRLNQAATELVQEKLSIAVRRISFRDCLDSFTKHGQTASASLVSCLGSEWFRCWQVGDVFGLLPTDIAPQLLCTPAATKSASEMTERLCSGEMRTDEASGIAMVPYGKGFLLRTDSLPAPSLDAFASVAAAADRAGTTLGECFLRAAAHPKRFVHEGEGGFDMNVLDCVHSISQRDAKALRLILIAGPSASGKTTFAAKLSLALRSCGFEPVVLSTDDYYKDTRDADYPRTADGGLNHEIVTALRLEDLARDMKMLFRGEEVNTPIFDMVLSRPKENDGRLLRMKPSSILIMEGIFALDPMLTASFSKEEVFKVFIVPVPKVQVDEHATLSNQVVRLLRRVSRDFLHRGRDAAASIKRVPTVQSGENSSIFKTIQFADYVMNSFVEHELSVLAVPLVPLLRSVQPHVWQYACARSLLRLAADHVCPVSDSHLPADSLIREFVGGSAFEVAVHETHTSEPPSTPAAVEHSLSDDQLFSLANDEEAMTYQRWFADRSLGPAALALVDRCELLSLKAPMRQRTGRHDVQPVPLASRDGASAIMSTGVLLLHAVVRSLWPDRQLHVQHGFADEASKTSSCVCAHIVQRSATSVHPVRVAVTDSELQAIEARMRQWIAERRPVDMVTLTTRQAASLFHREQMRMTSMLIETTRTPVVTVARLDKAYCLVMDPLLMDCSEIDFFLAGFDGGLEIDFPVFTNGMLKINRPLPPTPATRALYKHRELAIAAHQNITCVGDVNHAIFNGRSAEMIQVSEGLLAKQLYDVVRKIEVDKAGVVLLAGSSSSGKSVLCEQLLDQLHTNARRKKAAWLDVSTAAVTTITLDNFYRSVTDPLYPRTADGQLDYESVKALKLDALSNALDLLLVQRVPADVNVFDLGSGLPTSKTVRMLPPDTEDGVILAEGIFALQPEVVTLFREKLAAAAAVSSRRSAVLQVMVQPMPLVSLDELHYIPGQQLRVIRRIVRDFTYRQRDAQQTLAMWENVSDGEERNWLPFVDKADVIFNAHCVYEIGALRGSCQSLLQHVDPKFEPEYADAQRLLGLLRWNHVVPAARIPKQSIVQQLMEEEEEDDYSH
jgi:uridine kinase